MADDERRNLSAIQNTANALSRFVEYDDDDDDDDNNNGNRNGNRHVSRQESADEPNSSENDDYDGDDAPIVGEGEIGDSDIFSRLDGETFPADNLEGMKKGNNPLLDAPNLPADKVTVASGMTKSRLRQLFNQSRTATAATKTKSWTNLTDTAWTRAPFLTSWTEIADKYHNLQDANRSTIVAAVMVRQSRGPVYQRLLDAAERRRSRVDKLTETYRQEQRRQEQLVCTFRPVSSPPPRRHPEPPATPEPETAVSPAPPVPEMVPSPACNSPPPEPAPSRKPKPRTVFDRLHEEAVKRQQRQIQKSASMKELAQAQELHGCTFHPEIWSQISPRSGPVSQRLYDDARRRVEYVNGIRAELDPALEATFRPRVNARSRRLAKGREPAPVFERLYRAKLRDPSPIRGRPPWM